MSDFVKFTIHRNFASGDFSIFQNFQFFIFFRIHAFTGTLRTIALLFDIWVWYFAKNLVLMGDTDKTPVQELAEVEEQDVKQVEEMPLGI